MNGVKIMDKIDIANKFNQHFTNIGPDLANNISRSSKKGVDDFFCINQTLSLNSIK